MTIFLVFPTSHCHPRALFYLLHIHFINIKDPYFITSSQTSKKTDLELTYHKVSQVRVLYFPITCFLTFNRKH